MLLAWLVGEIGKRWGTQGYNDAFKARVAAGDPLVRADHDIKHLLKSLGRLAGMLEEMDHGEPGARYENWGEKMSRRREAENKWADTVIVAIGLALHWPGGPIDAVAVLARRLAEKFPGESAPDPLAEAAALEREACAASIEAMVVGGRAWTAEQETAANALFAAANAIRGRAGSDNGRAMLAGLTRAAVLAERAACADIAESCDIDDQAAGWIARRIRDRAGPAVRVAPSPESIAAERVLVYPGTAADTWSVALCDPRTPHAQTVVYHNGPEDGARTIAVELRGILRGAVLAGAPYTAMD